MACSGVSVLWRRKLAKIQMRLSVSFLDELLECLRAERSAPFLRAARQQS